MITRDVERGTYTYHFGNGRSRELPSIHRILAPVIDYTAPDYALNRGRLVHRALEIIDKSEGGGLHMDSLHPELRPRVEAYLDFKEHTGLKVFNLIEEPLVCLKNGFAGTPDRFTVSRIILEIKNGPPIGWEGLQLAGQAGLIQARSHLRSPPIRRSVHLFPNGKWKMETWDDSADWHVFLSLLDVHNWRIRNDRDSAGPD
ncbi:hypothetical protein LCGC14_1667310 [marine sediment metagenome]|uniref:Uncharacterized protein n=1 Tax=marine sediment metagenome TaxID=412755 RepID=A0A0F9HT11_9ZZZZ